MGHNKIKWIYTPDEVSDGIKKQVAARITKTLRKVTIKNIIMKLED